VQYTLKVQLRPFVKESQVNPQPAPKRIPMQDAARVWARMTGVPRPHRGTLIRWAVKGVRGQHLEAETIGGRWFTTREALEDFLRHVSQANAAPANRPAGPVRTAQVQQALDQLDELIQPHPGRAAT
jgi:hypothetical protein